MADGLGGDNGLGERILWWVVGIVVMLLGALSKIGWDKVVEVDREAAKRDDEMRRDFNAHVVQASRGYERLSAIEATLTAMNEERRETSQRIEDAVIRLHERFDKIMERE